MIVKPNILSILNDILVNKLGVDYQDRVWDYNSKGISSIISNPEDYKLFVIIEKIGTTPLSQTKEYKYKDGATPSLQCIQQNLVIEDIVLHICSRTDLEGNIEADTKYNDILFALNGDYCYQKQIEYGINIPPTPLSIINATEAETTQLITRFDMSLQITNWYSNIEDVAFYDKFTAELKYLEN